MVLHGRNRHQDRSAMMNSLLYLGRSNERFEGAQVPNTTRVPILHTCSPLLEVTGHMGGTHHFN